MDGFPKVSQEKKSNNPLWNFLSMKVILGEISGDQENLKTFMGMFLKEPVESYLNEFLKTVLY